MKKNYSLTFIILLAITAWSASAKILMAENNDGFYRLKIYSNKDLVTIQKNQSTLTLKTLDSNTFESIRSELNDVKNSEYISKIDSKDAVEGNTVFTLNIQLNDNVEIFSFYKNRDAAYFIDFWKDTGVVKQASSAIKAPVEVKKVAITKPTVVKKKVLKVIPVKKSEPVAKKEFRDFRYGASFIWDYEPILPKISKTIFLDRKTPEFFYTIKDREYEKSEQEAHMQLTINLYKKAKWGLMSKSIKLYEEKYKEDKNWAFNEFLKANALLKDSKERGDLKPVETAISMFTNIVERSPDYDLRRGLYKYLIQYFVEKNDNLTTLRYSKRFFADAKENFDYEELEYATEIILLSLSRLGQVEKIQALIEEKTIQKILPKVKQKAYEIYSLVKRGEIDQAIKKYEELAKTTKGDMLPSIYFNIAEAYFRKANYDESIKIFDTFLSKFSYHTSSSAARLRIALSSDLLDKKPNIVAQLYKDSINRSEVGDISLEARIRYVGLMTIRKIDQSEGDKESRVFLDKGVDKKITTNLEKLLWQVRLRSFLVDGQFENALSFLTALPLVSMSNNYKNVFENDGAEIVYGIIKKNYDSAQYAKSIRAWEIYKDVYFEKVANDPEIQFIIAKSYANLGLWNGFEKVYALIAQNKNEKSKTFPIWVDRTQSVKNELLEKELLVVRNINLKNWESVDKYIAQMLTIEKDYVKASFYKALSDVMQKNYSSAEKTYEEFFSQNANFNVIDGKDLLDSVANYMDAIYEQGKYNKFLEVSEALLKDSSNFKADSDSIKNMKQRANYLRVEVLFSQSKKDSVAESQKFLTEYKDSIYFNRVKFLLGREMIRVNNYAEGEKILGELANSTKVEDYLKEMVKSELTLLNIKKRTL